MSAVKADGVAVSPLPSLSVLSSVLAPGGDGISRISSAQHRTAALAAAGLSKDLSLENCFLGGINQPHLVQCSCMIETKSRSISDLSTRLLSSFP